MQYRVASQILNDGQRVRHRDGSLAGLALDGLDLTLPDRAANVDHPSLEIQVIRLQCQYFSNSHPGHCSDCEHGAKGMPCRGDNLPGLVRREEPRRFLHFLRGLYEFPEIDRFADISPVFGRGQYHRQSPRDIRGGLAGPQKKKT